MGVATPLPLGREPTLPCEAGLPVVPAVLVAAELAAAVAAVAGP